MVERQNPFCLNASSIVGNRAYAPLLQPVFSCVERLTKLSEFARQYDTVDRVDYSIDEFVSLILERLDISWEISKGSLESIPSDGAAVVVANHPFGCIEGVILAQALLSVRTDVKLLANFLLGRISELQELFYLVDPFERDGAKKKNIRPLRDSLSWLKKDEGLLGIFPSGEVSHFSVRKREVADPLWQPSVGRIIRKSKAPVVPVYFEGHNSATFQLLGLIHPLLRTSMLPRTLLDKRGQTIKMRIGSPIPYSRMERFKSDSDLMDYLRLRTYILEHGSDSIAPIVKDKEKSKFFSLIKKRPQEIIAREEESLLVREVEAIPEEQVLIRSGNTIVFYARAMQMPHLLREIGRLREHAFRAVGEGNGKSCDLDHFDNYYTHLVGWDEAKGAVVGAYRMAKTDEVLARYGVRGLYTNTLFHFDSKLLHQMGPAIEMGRSFVALQYQRNYSSLLLLWKGIARYIARHPQYKILFGTVSINNEYESVSRQLIISFLKANRLLPEFSQLVKARNPMKQVAIKGVGKNVTSTVVKDLKDVSSMLAEIETKQKTIPVLLKQYLNLGGRLLGFNIDANFGYALDALIYVDMTLTDPRFLERYMGKELLADFYTYHDRETGVSSEQLSKLTA